MLPPLPRGRVVPLVLPLLVALLLVATTRDVAANPRPLPFTYTSETLGEGEVEIEQFADLTPLRALSAQSGAPTWYLGTQFQTELEYGILPRLELGLYFTLAPRASDSLTQTGTMMEGNGLKQRLRYQLADPGAWPIDVGLYGEIVENDREIEFEVKILLQRRFGKLRIAANLWAEYERYFVHQTDVVLNPTLGATYQFTPVFHLGLESWMRVEFPTPTPRPRPFNVGPHVFVGPAVLLSFGKLWWSSGIYVRATDITHHPEPSASVAGESFGPVWFRTIVGYGF